MHTNKFCVLCLHEMLCHFKVTEMPQSSFDSKDLETSTPTDLKSLDRIETWSTSYYVFAWFINKIACAMFVLWSFVNVRVMTMH